MTDLRLRAYHELNGALFRKEAGWEVPSGYGSLDREVEAVRRAAGMADWSDRAKIRVRGADRITFVDGLLTADIAVLTPGRSAYGLLLDEASHVLGDLRVIALDDAFVLDVEASQKDGLLAYLTKQIVSDDVTLEDVGFCGHIEVHGPLAPRAVSAVLAVDSEGLEVNEHTTFPVDRHRDGFVSRLATYGEAGYAIWAPGDGLETLWPALAQSGAVAIGRDALEVLRIESGRPQFGMDMAVTTLALEVAPPGSVHSVKGCYRGQEVVARGLAAGRVGRRLLGLRIDGDVPPSHGDAVRMEAEEIGQVTSGCWSPTTGRVIGLALLRTAGVTPSSRLFIDHGGWDLRASLHPVPFVPSRA